MKIGIIVCPTNNLGDDIQSLAIIKVLKSIAGPFRQW